MTALLLCSVLLASAPERRTEAPTATSQAERFEVHPALRFGGEVLGGVLGGAAGFGTGLFLVRRTFSGDCVGCGPEVVFYLLAPIGVAAGISLAGALLGSHGQWWGAALGTLAGGAAAWALMALFGGPFLAFALATGVVLAVAGYELAAPTEPSIARPPPDALTWRF